MNKRITFFVFTFLAGWLACSNAWAQVLKFHNVIGVAQVEDQNGYTATNPEAVFQSDPYGFGDGSMGYILGATTTPTEFAGMNWPAAGSNVLSSPVETGVTAPASVSFQFEVPHNSLAQKTNPNLTIVVQDVNADYFYAGKNQGVVPAFQGMNGTAKTATYDEFKLTAAKADFLQSGGTGTKLGVLTRMAVVWSGWNTLGGSADIINMYVTNPTIRSKDSTGTGSMNVDHSPGGYSSQAEGVFNFQ